MGDRLPTLLDRRGGTAIKVAAMFDEHTRESLKHVAESTITAGRLVIVLKARVVIGYGAT